MRPRDLLRRRYVKLGQALLRVLLRVLLIGAAVLGVGGLLWLVLVIGPPWFIHDRSLEGLKAQNEVRTTLLQGLGGVVLLVGVFFTFRQLANSREQLAHSREQLQIAQQSHLTERFTRAVDQLGHAKLDVRLGGIYALERIALEWIARDSLTDHATIGEILTAFVRSHAPWPPRLPGQYVATAPIEQVPELRVWAPDVQACMTVLGRSGFASLARRNALLDLRGVDLRRADLHGADLEWARLSGAHLERADLSAANLEHADLRGAQLERADLGGIGGTNLVGAALIDANLAGANLGHARLEQATLFHANLKGADLGGADLKSAYLDEAHLEEAKLIGANLELARLYQAHLEGADLSGANLEKTSLVGVHLEGARLYTHLEGADLGRVSEVGVSREMLRAWDEET
jgi:uncharacterized protein YjbI with pentapeptide repeats